MQARDSHQIQIYRDYNHIFMSFEIYSNKNIQMPTKRLPGSFKTKAARAVLTQMTVRSCISGQTAGHVCVSVERVWGGKGEG